MSAMEKMAKAMSLAAIRSPNMGFWLRAMRLQIATMETIAPAKLLRVSDSGVIVFDEEAVESAPEEYLSHAIVHEVLHWAHNRASK